MSCVEDISDFFDDSYKDFAPKTCSTFHPIFPDSSFDEPPSKRIKLDSFSNSSLDQIEPVSDEKVVLQGIKRLKSLPKTLNNKKAIFELVQKYKLVCEEKSSGDDLSGSLTLSKVHFSEIRRKFGQNQYFLLVSHNTNVQTSKFVKTNHNYITFDDVFTFQCPLGFVIKIQLYVLRLTTKLKLFLERVPIMGKFREFFAPKTQNLPKCEAFELLDEFYLTCEDLKARDVGTIRDKITASKTFKYSLQIEQIATKTNRSGYLKFYLKNKFNWIRCWCTLSGTVFRICKSINEAPTIFFDLKYASYSEIDVNDVLIVKYLRPRRETDDPKIASKSRNNFVVVKLCFKALSLQVLELWMREFNDVVKAINAWNSSFLDEIELNLCK